MCNIHNTNIPNVILLKGRWKGRDGRDGKDGMILISKTKK
jgi:hypothetical protein